MASQYAQTDPETLRGIAQIVVDEYIREMTEHDETPDVSARPALDDIIDAQATSAGMQSDDNALLAAVRAEFERGGQEVPRGSWLLGTYSEYERV